jgi:hypothetical protein
MALWGLVCTKISIAPPHPRLSSRSLITPPLLFTIVPSHPSETNLEVFVLFVDMTSTMLNNVLSAEPEVSNILGHRLLYEDKLSTESSAIKL